MNRTPPTRPAQPPPPAGPAAARLTFREAARLCLGRAGGGMPPSPYTLVRWHQRGVQTASGGRAFLAAEKHGSVWTTTADDMEQFLAGCTGVAPTAPARRSPAALRRAAEADHRRAVAMGLYTPPKKPTAAT